MCVMGVGVGGGGTHQVEKKAGSELIRARAYILGYHQALQ